MGVEDFGLTWGIPPEAVGRSSEVRALLLLPDDVSDAYPVDMMVVNIQCVGGCCMSIDDGKLKELYLPRYGIIQTIQMSGLGT